MRVNGSDLNLNSSVLPRDPPAEGAPRRPPWVTATLAAILIFTIVVDLLGNLLVILSVYRNKKLRNAEISFTGTWQGYALQYCVFERSIRLQKSKSVLDYPCSLGDFQVEGEGVEIDILLRLFQGKG